MTEYYYLPKLIALAERAWAGQDDWAEIADLDRRVEAVQEAWNRFANTIGQREMTRLEHIFGGYAYRLPPPGAIVEEGMLHANVEFPGLTVRYTTDGTDPDMESPVYTGPVQVDGSVRLRTFSSAGRGSRASAVE